MRGRKGRGLFGCDIGIEYGIRLVVVIKLKKGKIVLNLQRHKKVSARIYSFFKMMFWAFSEQDIS